MHTATPQINSPLRDILYRSCQMEGQDGVQYEYWFVFDACCLHHGLNLAFEYVAAPPAGALPIPRTQDPMCMKNPHASLFGAPLCGIYDDGDEENSFILCFDNGHVVHLYTAYMYSDPTATPPLRTLDFYTPLRLSDIDYLDFASYIADARALDKRIPPG